MKKLVLSLVAVAAFGYAANAQEKEKGAYNFEQGNIIVEGAFTISDKTTKPEGSGDEIKTTNFNFNPKAAYFLNDKFAVGVELGFGKEQEEGVSVHYNTTYAGAFARYYFLELGKRFKTYGEVGLGYKESKERNVAIAEKQTGIKAGVTVGMNYFVTPKLAIGFNLGDIFAYENYNVKEGDTKTKNVSETNAKINVFNNFFDTAKFSLTYKF
ncbi:MAG: porin family protein [Flavobacteriaceae bacterium]|jgi:outer membrane protein|nr:porin family protein [Flavobacteriaceae bacterium]